MNDKSRIKVLLFGSGMEAAYWLGMNCERCWRGNHAQGKELDRPSRCCIQSDILNQWIDGEDYKPTRRAVDAVRMAVCPRFEEHRQKRQVKKHRDAPGQQKLNFEQ